MKRRPRAYILIVVLGLTVVVSTLALEFAQSNATAMPASTNRLYTARAQYLSESGVALAGHYLVMPPTTVAANDYWRGGSGIAVDGGADFVNVTVARTVADPYQYVITSTAAALQSNGTVGGKQSITARVIAPSTGKYTLTKALAGQSALNVPLGVYVNGDVLANGALTGLGAVSGTAASTELALWTGLPAPAQVVSNASAVPLLAGTPLKYLSYTLDGKSFSATAWGSNSMSTPDAVSWNARDFSTTNPGRIIEAGTGNFKLKNENVNLNGTLVVQGNLELDGNATITAQAGFPALVVTGNIEFKRDTRTVVVNGMVVCAGTITDNGENNSRLTVNGPTITKGSPAVSSLGSAFRFNFDSTRSVIWDFEGIAPRDPITFVDWDEQ